MSAARRPRIGLALALPIAGLLAVSLWVLAGYYRTAQDIGNIRSVAELAPAIGGLVHALQRERDVATGLIGAESAMFAEKLRVRHQETEERWMEFVRALSRVNTERIGGLASRTARACEAVDQIATWRSTSANRSITATKLTKLTRQYSDAIVKLTEVVEEMLFVGTNTNLTQIIFAYSYLIHAKEAASLERAAGVAWFAANRFDPVRI